jgi:putative transcriptional regulator
MIRHHPSETTLITLAAGHLPVLHSRVLAVHLSACPHCRRELHRLEEVGGALIETTQPVALGEGALSRVLVRLDEPEPAETVPAAPEVPVTLRDLALGRWWWLGPGIRLMPLSPRDASGTRLDLIRVAPGIAMPGHGHTGSEIACILQGAYADETGEYRAYDIAEGDAGLDHAPIASGGQECICLIATTGRLRGHTWLARLVQPLIDV